MAKVTDTRTGISMGWASGQDGWGADMNTNIQTGLLFLTQPNVLDKDLTAPPGSPTAGDTYIVGGSATGDWSGEDGNLAKYWQGYADSSPEWKFFDMSTEQEGVVVWVADENRAYAWSGSAWVAKDTISISLSSASNTALGASHSGANKLRLYTVPRALTLLAVKATCSAVTVITGVSIDVYRESGTPASLLSAAMTITTALAVVDGTVSISALAADDVLGLRATTQTGDDLTNASVTLYAIEA